MSPRTIRVPLSFDAPPVDPRTGAMLPVPVLTFDLEPHGLAHKRLRPLVARPRLGLWGAYTPRARIDWLRLALTTRDVTQSQYVSQLLEPILGRRPRVTGPEGETHHTGTRFLITIQDPTPGSVVAALEALRAARGLTGPIPIAGMEVALDFHPKDGSDAARRLMAELLAGTLMPPPEHLNEDRNRGRWFHLRPRPGGATRSARFMVHAAAATATVDGEEVPFELDPRSHHQAPVDRTRYFGEMGCGRMIRVQDKITDAKNPDADPDGQPLAQAERRARVEAELLAPFDDDLRLVELADLKRFEFQKLRNRYFRFKLPTFDAEGPELERRVEVFERTGVYGLLRYDAAFRATWPDRCRPTGANADMIALKVLHDMARDALRKLNETWGSLEA